MADSNSPGAPTTGEGSRRAFRRRTRAATACVRCHHRKVRCDLTLRQPCTNCLLDGEKCNSRERRRRGPSPLHSQSLDKTDCDWEAHLHPPHGGQNHDESTEETSPPSREAHSIESPVPTSLFEDADYLAQALRPTFTHPRRRETFSDEPSQMRRISYPSLQSDIIYSAYPFVNITGLSKLPQEDIQFLEVKSCLRLPTRPYLDEFIRQYFRYVHPCLPVLNETEFWTLYHADEGIAVPGRSISLFILQAMLYVSSAFVSPETIREAGYKYVKHARKVFYTRAKILHDLSAEQSPLSRAIGALILTHRFNQEDRQAGSIWLGIAIQNARASRDVSWGDGSISAQSPLKRLWSCIHLRDRIISMGLRRPMQLPSKEDIEAYALTEEDLAGETHHSLVYDAATKSQLNQILVQQYRLGILMGEVMHITQHQSANPDAWRASATTSTKTKPRVSAVQERLQLWHEQASASFKDHSEGEEPHLSAVMFSNITLIYYYATNISLATYELRQLAKEEALTTNPTLRSEKRLEQIRQKLKTACFQTERLAMLFVNHGVVECLPMTVLSYLAFPLLLRVLETNSPYTGHEHRSVSDNPVYCAQVIRQCDTRYEGGDHVLSLIKQATASMSEYKQLSVVRKSPAAGVRGRARKPAGRDEVDDLQQRTVSTAWERLLLMKPALFGQISDCFYDAMSRGKGNSSDDFPALLGVSLPAVNVLDENEPREICQDVESEDSLVLEGVTGTSESVHQNRPQDKKTPKALSPQNDLEFVAESSAELGYSHMLDLESSDPEPEPESNIYTMPDMVRNWWEAEQSWAEDLFQDVARIPG